MRAAAIAGRLASLAPWFAAAWIPAFTPTRALLACGLIEAVVARDGDEDEGARAFALRLGAGWLLLHGLRSDAPWPLGVALLGALVALRPFWARRPAWRVALPLLVLLPAAASFALSLDDREPGALASLDLWRAAGPGEPLLAVSLTPEVPEGAALSALPFVLPERVEPHPLEDSFDRGRALVLVAALLLIHALAVTLSRRRAEGLLLGGLVLAGSGPLLGRQPDACAVWFEQRDAGGTTTWSLLEVHAPGADLWDPLRGPLLAPRGPHELVPEPEGRVRVIAAAPWAVVREMDGPPKTDEEPRAWLEVHPLRAPRSGGAWAESGGLGLLRTWLAGEAGDAGGVRWELAEDGSLTRRVFP